MVGEGDATTGALATEPVKGGAAAASRAIEVALGVAVTPAVTPAPSATEAVAAIAPSATAIEETAIEETAIEETAVDGVVAGAVTKDRAGASEGGVVVRRAAPGWRTSHGSPSRRPSARWCAKASR